jgi:putative serine protease PepD
MVEKFFPNRSVLVRPTDVQEVLAKVLPAVVSIATQSFAAQGTFSGNYVIGAGTGMVISPNGEVLTNNHVVAGASTVTVTLYGQSEVRQAKVIGTDPATDLALIQIEGVSGLPTVTFGNSATARVGDSVLAIGNALDLVGGPTVTEGIVSAENRQLTAEDPLTNTPEHLSGLIQTDAAINPGNSGGPLVNSDAQVIGIDTAVATSADGNAPAQDIGFAIAINTAKPLIPVLRRGGTVNQPAHPGGAFLGVEVESVTAALARQDHLATTSGALVTGVVPGAPAGQAGLHVGDVIVQIGSTAVANVEDLTGALGMDQPGEKVVVTFYRGSARTTLQIVLGTR